MPRRKATDTESAQQAPALPQVELVKKCAGYDPVPFMIDYTYPDTGVKSKYLEVKYRTDWFLHWCAENGVTPFIDESEFQIIESLRLVIATCCIYLDGALAAKSTASREFIGEGDRVASNAVQTAFTFAKGRALANLGFGTVFGNAAENGEPFPPDAGITFPTPTNNPMFIGSNTATPPAAADAGNSGAGAGTPPPPPPAQKPAAAKVTNAMPKTADEARAVICRFGKHKGQTIGEVFATDPSMLDWVLSDAFGSKTKYPEEVEACRILKSA